MSEIVRGHDQVTVRPHTDIVASMSNDFKRELKGLLDEQVTNLVVDLDGVQMLDSVGLGVLIATHNSLVKAGGKLTVTGMSKDIHRLLKTMRLDKHFNVVVTEKEPCHGPA